MLSIQVQLSVRDDKPIATMNPNAEGQGLTLPGEQVDTSSNSQDERHTDVGHDVLEKFPKPDRKDNAMQSKRFQVRI